MENNIKWKRPVLVVINRGKQGEHILMGCKGGNIGGATAIIDYCTAYENPKDTCYGTCNLPATS